MPLKSVLDTLDLLGEEVIPVLRKELAGRRPGSVPEVPPTHASLLADRETLVSPAPERSGSEEGAE